ncbi:MAG: O-antigen ligase family protein [Nitrospirae bacterium]|nr:O-antigen ligase family protein [Nitrospirota bacterium]
MPPAKDILNDVKFAALMIFAVSMVFSESVKLITLYGVLIPVFFIQLYRRETGISVGLLEWGFIAFFITSLFSGLFASDIPEYFKGIKDVTRIVALFFIASTVTGQRRAGTVLRCLYGATAVMAVFGIAAAVKLHKPLDIHMLGHYNYTAMYLIIVANALISTIVFSEIRTKLMKAAAALALFIIITATVMTTMRAAFLTLFLFSAIIAFARRKSLVSKVMAAGFAVFALGAAYVFKPMWTKLASGESFIRRLYIWKYALRAIVESRGCGVGLNNFKYTFAATLEGGRSIYDAHSVYINTAVQSGVAGLMALLAIGAGVIRRWLSIKGGASVQEIKYAALGAALVVFVGGAFDTTLHHETGMLFSILTGFMAGLTSDPEV